MRRVCTCAVRSNTNSQDAVLGQAKEVEAASAYRYKMSKQSRRRVGPSRVLEQSAAVRNPYPHGLTHGATTILNVPENSAQ